jgi:hypothetical protein
MPRQGMRKEAGETPGRGGPGKHGTPVTAEIPDHAWHATAARHPGRHRAGTGARRARAAPGFKRASPGQAKPEEIHAIRLAWEDAGTTAA